LKRRKSGGLRPAKFPGGLGVAWGGREWGGGKTKNGRKGGLPTNPGAIGLSDPKIPGAAHGVSGRIPFRKLSGNGGHRYFGPRGCRDVFAAWARDAIRNRLGFQVPQAFIAPGFFPFNRLEKKRGEEKHRFLPRQTPRVWGPKKKLKPRPRPGPGFCLEKQLGEFSGVVQQGLPNSPGKRGGQEGEGGGLGGEGGQKR